MKLLQVRKGQLVYFNNELHKVYSVKPLAKKSVLMFRLKDMEQVASKAEQVSYYKPKHLDSFLFLGARYTLRDDIPAEPGGYIFITKPDPDYMDHYSLNEFEKVESVEGKDVVTTRQNTVKFREFFVMVPGEEPGSNDITYFDKAKVAPEQLDEDALLEEKAERRKMPSNLLSEMYT
nr:hypothetical protein [Planococcus glaciei]